MHRASGVSGHGRRSKLDIVGDVLRAISEGSEKPTNVMFRANLTWPLTISYLELLLRHRMITREDDGDRSVYRIAPKGAELLRSYREVTEGVAELGLDRMDVKLLSKVTDEPPKGAAPLPHYLEPVKTAYERRGYKAAPEILQGRSGEEHRFDLVMKGEDGKRVCFIGTESATEWEVIRAFVLQNDCDTKVMVVSPKDPTKEAVDLAGAYGLGLIGGQSGYTAAQPVSGRG